MCRFWTQSHVVFFFLHQTQLNRMKLILSIIALTITSIVLAQDISIQGVLRDPNGRSVEDGVYTVTFNIYEEPSGGTALWTDTYNNLQVKHGVFQANLGENTSLDGLAFDATYYVGVKVGNFAEMTPRIALTTYPYAKAILGQENKFPSVGNVVLERDSIIVRQGALKFEGADGRIVFNDGTSLNTAEFGGPAASLLNPSSININADKDTLGSGNINLQIAGELKAQLNNNGKFGIGVQDPDNTLDISSPDFFVAQFAGTHQDGTSLQLHGTGHNWEITATGSTNGSGSLYFYDQTSGANRLNIQGDGTVDVGGRLNTGYLYSSDVVQAANGLVATNGFFGVDATALGVGHFYGSGAGNERGGEIELFTASDHQAGLDYWFMAAHQNDLRIGNPNRLDALRITEDGKLGISYWQPTARLHVSDFSGLNLSTPGAMTLGDDAFSNLAFDDNDIQARNNGAASTLHLNTFGGNVHLGGEAPESSALLVGKNDVAEGYLIVHGDATSQEGGEIQLFNSAAHDDNFEYWFMNVFEDDLRFGSSGGSAPFGDVLTLAASGNVGIGNNNPITGKLVVGGSVVSRVTNFNFLGNPARNWPASSAGNGWSGIEAETGYHNSWRDYDVSIMATGRIVGTGFSAYSDKRIKNIIGKTNNEEDLEALKSIEITDYTHIDEVNKGRAVHKKVIAQQVEEVFPNAVSRTQGYVPSHYAMAEKQVFDHLTNHMQITCASPHGFEVSDQVKLFGTEGEILVDVLEVIDAMTFVVEVAHAEEQVFVYGKMVDDFRTVDYEAISMLNVSATQQLAKQLEEQQKLIEKLQVENAELKEKLKKVDVLEAKLDIILNMQGDKSEEGTLLGQK